MKKFKNDKNNEIASRINMQKFLERGVQINESGIWANLWFDYNYRRCYMNEHKLKLYEKLSKKLNRPMEKKRE